MIKTSGREYKCSATQQAAEGGQTMVWYALARTLVDEGIYNLALWLKPRVKKRLAEIKQEIARLKAIDPRRLSGMAKLDRRIDMRIEKMNRRNAQQQLSWCQRIIDNHRVNVELMPVGVSSEF
jgi:uncharacterized protein (DUF885 family)